MQLSDPFRVALALMHGKPLVLPPLIPENIPAHEAERTQLLLESVKRIKEWNPPRVGDVNPNIPPDEYAYLAWIP